MDPPSGNPPASVLRPTDDQLLHIPRSVKRKKEGSLSLKETDDGTTPFQVEQEIKPQLQPVADQPSLRGSQPIAGKDASKVTKYAVKVARDANGGPEAGNINKKVDQEKKEGINRILMSPPRIYKSQILNKRRVKTASASPKENLQKRSATKPAETLIVSPGMEDPQSKTKRAVAMTLLTTDAVFPKAIQAVKPGKKQSVGLPKRTGSKKRKSNLHSDAAYISEQMIGFDQKPKHSHADIYEKPTSARQSQDAEGHEESTLAKQSQDFEDQEEPTSAKQSQDIEDQEEPTLANQSQDLEDEEEPTSAEQVQDAEDHEELTSAKQPQDDEAQEEPTSAKQSQFTPNLKIPELPGPRRPDQTLEGLLEIASPLSHEHCAFNAFHGVEEKRCQWYNKYFVVVFLCNKSLYDVVDVRRHEFISGAQELLDHLLSDPKRIESLLIWQKNMSPAYVLEGENEEALEAMMETFISKNIPFIAKRISLQKSIDLGACFSKRRPSVARHGDTRYSRGSYSESSSPEKSAEVEPSAVVKEKQSSQSEGSESNEALSEGSAEEEKVEKDTKAPLPPVRVTVSFDEEEEDKSVLAVLTFFGKRVKYKGKEFIHY